MPIDPYISLKNRDFRRFISARLLITIAMEMQGVIVGWQIIQYTKDPLLFGLIALTEAIPYILTSLFAGHVADVVQRKKIVMVSAAILSVLTFILFTFTLNNGYFITKYGIMPVYAIIFLTGIGRAFVFPALFAFMSQIVPREHYANATTWNSTSWQVGAIAGPAIGGFLCILGVGIGYLTGCIFTFVGMFLFSFIKPRLLPEKQIKEPLFASLSKGIKFVFGNKVIIGTLSLDLFAVLFGGAISILPLFATTILHTNSVGFSLLRAAPSVGAVIMAPILAHRPPFAKAGRNMLMAVAGFGVCIILFAISRNIYLSIFILACSGAFDSISVIIRATALQLLTPDDMRGRVSSVNYIFLGSSNEIGGFESGLVARLMGLIPSIIFGGSMTIVVVAFTSLKAKALRSLHLDTKK